MWEVAPTVWAVSPSLVHACGIARPPVGGLSITLRVVYLCCGDGAVHLVSVEHCLNDCDQYGWTNINEQYVASAGLHVLSAVMYLFAWYGFLGEYR